MPNDYGELKSMVYYVIIPLIFIVFLFVCVPKIITRCDCKYKKKNRIGSIQIDLAVITIEQQAQYIFRSNSTASSIAFA